MKPTLVILAAGMASRYGSMKQIQSFGPSGETIMDYSIYDAMQAGFGKIVFIIREDFSEQFKAIFEPKLHGKIETDYVFQHLSAFTEGKKITAERAKPWGTAHAVLCCKGKLNEPFAVINADDFYGKDAFVQAAAFLNNQCNDKTYSIIGYELGKTLSDNGTVSRGVCSVDADGNLLDINERTKIFKNDDGIIVYDDNDALFPLTPDTIVSMNFLCYPPSFVALCESEFSKFLDAQGMDMKSEFFLPSVTKHFVNTKLGNVKVATTSSSWFGVTYKEDAPVVQVSITNLVEKGLYPNNLWQ
jgi:hypothetical protein